MTGKEFIKAIAKRSNSTYDRVSATLDAFREIVGENLSKGEDVTFNDFGKFYMTVTEERMGRNPHTGEPMTIPRKQIPKFTAAKWLKETVRGEADE